MNYKYVNDLDGISQYDDFDLENNKIVNARYIHALVDEDRGNPYIEALPLPRDEKSITRGILELYLIIVMMMLRTWIHLKRCLLLEHYENYAFLYHFIVN